MRIEREVKTALLGSSLAGLLIGAFILPTLGPWGIALLPGTMGLPVVFALVSEKLTKWQLWLVMTAFLITCRVSYELTRWIG